MLYIFLYNNAFLLRKALSSKLVEDTYYIWFLACKVISRSFVLILATLDETWRYKLWIPKKKWRIVREVVHLRSIFIGVVCWSLCWMELLVFCLAWFILCYFSSEIITPLFMFILTMPPVKTIFIIWVSIRSFYCFFYWESGCFLQDLL